MGLKCPERNRFVRLSVSPIENPGLGRMDRPGHWLPLDGAPFLRDKALSALFLTDGKSHTFLIPFAIRLASHRLYRPSVIEPYRALWNAYHLSHSCVEYSTR